MSIVLGGLWQQAGKWSEETPVVDNHDAINSEYAGRDQGGWGGSRVVEGAQRSSKDTFKLYEIERNLLHKE